jgi:alanyl-tRNA synthetase
LDRTPFYPEGGGQVGDQGWLIHGDDQVEVLDTKRENQLIVHFTKDLPKNVESRAHRPGGHFASRAHRTQSHGHAPVAPRAAQTPRHACGTERLPRRTGPPALRHQPLRQGDAEELATIEREVNAMIADDIVFEDKRNVPIAEAKAMGAMALFGEKYGDNVRVVKFGPAWSCAVERMCRAPVSSGPSAS